MAWIYAHVPLIAALVLAADAGGDLASLDITSTKKLHHGPLSERNESVIEINGGGEEEEEKNMYALSFFYTGGIAVSLISMFVLGLVEKVEIQRVYISFQKLTSCFKITNWCWNSHVEFC